MSTLRANRVQNLEGQGIDVANISEGKVPYVVRNITALSSLNTDALVEGQAFNRLEFWSGSGVGSVELLWIPDEPTENHDGVKTIDPRRCSEPNQEKRELNDYYTSVGGNTGCFVVSGDWDATAAGALGDDQFDNAPVIHHLLTVVGSSHFPDGNYLINNPVEALIPFDITLALSPNAVLIGGAYDAPAIYVSSANPGSEPYKSFSLVGGSMDNSRQLFVGAAQSGTCLSFVRLNEVLVSKTKFYALDTYEESIAAGVGDSAITTVDCRTCTFEGLVITGQPDLGIYLSGQATGGPANDGGQYVITNCHFVACDAAISGKRNVAGVVVSNNTFFKCRNGVLLLEAGSGVGPGDNTIIANNTFKLTAQRCAEVRVGSGSIVQGNIFEDTGYNLDGLTPAASVYTARLLGATGSQVSNNLFVMKDLVTYAGQHAVNLNNYTPVEFDDNVNSENNFVGNNTVVNYDGGVVVSGGGSANNTFLHNQYINVPNEFTGDLSDNTVINSGGGLIGFQKNSNSLNINGFSFSRDGQMRAVSDGTQSLILNRRGTRGELAAFFGQTEKQGFIETNDGFGRISQGAYSFFGSVPAADVGSNTFFVDSADGVLKYRDSGNTLRVVNLT